MKFETIEDAKVYYQNSGVYSWKWFDGFSEDKFIDYLFEHGEEDHTENDLVASFLVANGEKPEDYNLKN